MSRATRGAVFALLGAVVLLAGACGDSDDGNGSSASGERTVRIRMVDTAFEPAAITVPQGETVRFIFENTGKLVHDAFVGDEEAQTDHETEMRSDDEGGHGGHAADSDAVTVDPGHTGELTHTFSERDEVKIGCHQPGHYAAGMQVKVSVDSSS